MASFTLTVGRVVCLSIVMLTLSGGCGAPSEPERPRPGTLVVDHDRWTPRMSSPQFGAADPGCTARGYGVEPAGFEINTDLCDGVTFEQALALDLPAGTRLYLSGWHGDLWAPQPGHGRLVVAIGGEVLAELSSPIPARAAAQSWEITLERPALAGEIIALHVRNHGANQWTLGRVEVL